MTQPNKPKKNEKFYSRFKYILYWTLWRLFPKKEIYRDKMHKYAGRLYAAKIYAARAYDSYDSSFDASDDSEYQNNMDFGEYKPKIKTLAFYLPQFHRIPENDEWWGEGFTEWTNTRQGIPRFEGHYQPKEPHGDIGYYDLSDVETLKRQAKLAKQHHVYGFCFYYYWFSGKRLLEKPLDLLLEHTEIDINFCICWANENWTRVWRGSEKDILLKQEDREDDAEKFIDDLKKYVNDRRYVRINDKPVIVVYNPQQISDSGKMFKKWRRRAQETGIGEILIWICRTWEKTAKSLNLENLIDAEVELPPHSNKWFEELRVDDVLKAAKSYVLDYHRFAELKRDEILSEEKNKGPVPLYRCCMLGWDNAARKGTEYTCVTYCRFTLKSFYMWVNAITEEASGNDDSFMFVNAWNEWGEGTYLEPDKKYGYANINTLSKAICGIPFDGGVKVINYSGKTQDKNVSGKIAVHIHMFYVDLIDEIIDNINNIPRDFDCYVSTDSAEKAGYIKKEFSRKCKANKTTVEIFENRGRDVFPFLAQMRQHMEQYGLVCHIHSKKTNGTDAGFYWRRFLFKHLLGNSGYITAVLKEFDDDPQLGLIFPETYPLMKPYAELIDNEYRAISSLEKMGIDVMASGHERVFPVGNMFWARTKAIRKLFLSGIPSSDFEAERGQVNLTLAHAIERIWLYIARAEGYHFKKTFNNVYLPVQKYDRKNLLLFAHYDENNVISGDDMRYLKSLKKAAERIIFISNSALGESETAKISAIADKMVLRENSGFHFGAWGQVLSRMPRGELNEFDNLILVNNSCHGLFKDPRNIFAEMDEKKADFWGMMSFPRTEEITGGEKTVYEKHPQSFFLVLSKKAFLSPGFSAYWSSEKEPANDRAIRDCEIKLTKALCDSGMTYAVYVPESEESLYEMLQDDSLCYSMPYQALIAGLPMLKKKYKEFADAEEKISAEFFISQISVY